jgi:hypothetical protein
LETVKAIEADKTLNTVGSSVRFNVTVKIAEADAKVNNYIHPPYNVEM